MSAVYNPEADLIAEIETFELEARMILGKVEHCRDERDKRVLNRLLQELKEKIDFLRRHVP
jgi:hypothetical protein